MQFLDAVKIVFKKYADFRGVSTRPEYWWFTLFVFLVTVIASALDLAIRQSNSGPIQMLVSWALLIPQLSVMVRRNRDAGFSAWWLMSWTLPFIAFIASIYVNLDAMRAWFAQVADPNFTISSDEQIIANLVQLSVFFGPALITLGIVAIFFFVVSLLPSKKPKQPVVATLDY